MRTIIKVIGKLKVERPTLIKLLIILFLATIIALTNNNTVLEWLRDDLLFYIWCTTFKKDPTK